MPSTLRRGLTWLDRIFLAAILVKTPLVLGWSHLKSLFVAKPRKRYINDRLVRYLTDSFNIRQLQYMLGQPTLKTYLTWMENARLEPVIEHLNNSDGAKLLWVGPKRTDKIIFFVHGGAFLVSMPPSAIPLWRHVQEQIKSEGDDVGLVVLNYGLLPGTKFPIPLKQIVLGLRHLLDGGMIPENIQIVGNSAGANLILQLVSHALHPLEGIPALTLSAPLGGIYLLSPWVNLSGDPLATNTTDILSPRQLARWGREVLLDVPKNQTSYAEPVKAPFFWFCGIDKVVRRLLISAGEGETLKGDIVEFHRTLDAQHSDVKLVVQAEGVHDDPYHDFEVGQKPLGALTPLIVDWLVAGFRD